MADIVQMKTIKDKNHRILPTITTLDFFVSLINFFYLIVINYIKHIIISLFFYIVRASLNLDFLIINYINFIM